jgi:hypothetical protein
VWIACGGVVYGFGGLGRVLVYVLGIGMGVYICMYDHCIYHSVGRSMVLRSSSVFAMLSTDLVTF